MLHRSGIPIDATVLSVAKGKSAQVFRTVTIGDQNYRELIVRSPANSIVSCADGSRAMIKTTSAELFVVDITVR